MSPQNGYSTNDIIPPRLRVLQMELPFILLNGKIRKPYNKMFFMLLIMLHLILNITRTIAWVQAAAFDLFPFALLFFFLQFFISFLR
jgi:hypothetical protein